jgi:anti-sigma factor RsiW
MIVRNECGLDLSAASAYVDGEFAAPEAEAFEVHMAGCARCTAEVASLMKLKREMRVAKMQFAPSAEFRMRMRKQVVASVSKEKSTQKKWAWPAMMAMAAALLVVVSVGVMRMPSKSGGWDEVADLHVTAMASVNPYDVVSSDRHTVKPWFQGRIPFSFNIPEMAGTGYELLGGRLVYLHQQPVAQLIVARGAHRISVLVSRDDSGAGVDENGGVHNSFHTASWRAGELRFRVVGDADAGAIDGLAGLMRGANR